MRLAVTPSLTRAASSAPAVGVVHRLVDRCPRCSRRHASIAFRPLKTPMVDGPRPRYLTHWAECPVLQAQFAIALEDYPTAAEPRRVPWAR